MENPAVPELARNYGLKVLAGAYLDNRQQRNEDELRALIESARHNDNVDRLMVGHETLYRADMGVGQLIGYIDRVRAATGRRRRYARTRPR